ncbi:MAG TPA: amidohydrolase family protein [Candidatus Limnocylindria bacterium]|nr:amidohydrolase family protein [Candidatus Limnocylindria bacterium]
MTADLFVKDARVVKPDAIVECGLAIRDGVIAAALAPGETVDARRTIDAGGRYVLPGLLDTHLHLGNAAQSFAADCASESRHAVTGGVTTLLPFVITRGSYFEVLPEMQKAVGAGSLVDMVFHAIIIREAQIEEIPRMAHEFGVRSFKTFMAYKGREISPSGIQGMGDDQIFSVFRQVAKIPGGLAIVHCENMEVIELHQQPFIAAHRQDTAAWSDARPVFGELEAIRRMVAFAEAAGVELLIPHMGVGLGSEFLRQKAWGRGRVATETCPHYLLFDKDTDRGVMGKVNPPLRSVEHVEALWQRLLDGTVDVLGSDHCPFTKAVKGTDLWAARAGVTAGSAMILPVLLTEGVRRGRLTIQRVVELTSANAARLFGLYPRKGALEVGSDADLVIVDLDREVKVDLRTLNSVVDFSPYEGWLARGWADTTIAGGQVVYDKGEVVAERPRGRYLARGG